MRDGRIEGKGTVTVYFSTLVVFPVLTFKK